MSWASPADLFLCNLLWLEDPHGIRLKGIAILCYVQTCRRVNSARLAELARLM